MVYKIVKGNLLEQNVEVIVNSWNRNIIPFFLLLPQGVSGAIKKQIGSKPFFELMKLGPIPSGGVKKTNSYGLNNFKYIFHVAGINMFWFATEYSIKESIKNSMELAKELNINSIAFPLIDSGSGNRSKEIVKKIMLDTFNDLNYDIEVIIVEYKK